METRTCHLCGTVCGKAAFCQTCVANFPNRRSADDMAPAERGGELVALFGVLEMPFDLVHQRIEELVGRPVWTHEMGLNKDGLIAEARGARHATMDEIVGQLAQTGKLVIVLTEDGRQTQP